MISTLPVNFNFEEGSNFTIEPEEEIDWDSMFNLNKGDADETIVTSNNLSHFLLSIDCCEDFPLNDNLNTSPSFTFFSFEELEFTFTTTPLEDG